GAPVIEIGREYVFFRTGVKSNTTVGMRQGIFSVEQAIVSGVDRTVLISGDGEPLVATKGGIARGKRLEILDKQIVSAKSEAHERMDTNARPEGAGIRQLLARVSAASTLMPAFATLDDLRTFVRAKQEK